MIPELHHVSEFEECSIFQEERNPFALYLSTTRICCFPRFRINTRIVVVGSSEVGIAFLESLIFHKHPKYHVIFNNITLISTHGIPYQKSEDPIRDAFFVKHGVRDHKRMQMINMRTYINIVNGIMTEIDRKNRKLIVNYNNAISYDLLFLMCGEQFQKPKFKEQSVSKQKKKKKQGSSSFPKNVFVVNSEVDASHCISKLSDILLAETAENCKWEKTNRIF